MASLATSRSSSGTIWRDAIRRGSGTARAPARFQVTAASIAGDEHLELLPLVTLDERLAQAARREGFPVLP